MCIIYHIHIHIMSLYVYEFGLGAHMKISSSSTNKRHERWRSRRGGYIFIKLRATGRSWAPHHCTTTIYFGIILNMPFSKQRYRYEFFTHVPIREYDGRNREWKNVNYFQHNTSNCLFAFNTALYLKVEFCA